MADDHEDRIKAGERDKLAKPINEPKFKVGEAVCCRDRKIRGRTLKRGTIGHITRIPMNIKGEFQGYYHVKFSHRDPEGPGMSAAIAEGLLYRPRRSRKQTKEE